MKSNQAKHKKVPLLLIVICTVGCIFAAYYLINNHIKHQRAIKTRQYFSAISSLPHAKALPPSYSCRTQVSVLFEDTYCATSFEVDFTNDQMDTVLKKLADMGFFKLSGPPQNGEQDYFFLPPSINSTTGPSLVITNFLTDDNTWHLVYSI